VLSSSKDTLAPSVGVHAVILVRMFRQATGLETEDQVVRHLESTLPREHVLDGARAINSFVDRFLQHMRHRMDAEGGENPNDFVVTKECVDDFVCLLQQRDKAQ
jgi:hypothetical protein